MIGHNQVKTLKTEICREDLSTRVFESGYVHKALTLMSVYNHHLVPMPQGTSETRKKLKAMSCAKFRQEGFH